METTLAFGPMDIKMLEDPKDVAREFIENNPELIDEWTEGISVENE